MRILLIGDSHLKISKFNACVKFLDEVRRVVVETKPDMVVNLGDTFNDHAVLRSELMSVFRMHILHIVKMLDIPYYYILGNHDQYQPKDNKYHALETFKDIVGFHVIDRVTKVGNITMVPYIAEIEKFPTETQEICFAHQTFIGADYGYHRPDIGVNADNVSAKIIISGHIHKKQSFGKVFYVGSAFSQDANDIDQLKGLHIFDTSTLDLSFVDIDMPQFKSIQFDLSDVSIEDVVGILTNVDTNDNYVVALSGTKADIDRVVSYPAIVEIRQLANMRIVPEYKDSEKREFVRIKKHTMDDIIKEYVSKVYVGEIDKQKLIDDALTVWNNYGK
jgi:DNA repair exonuclease SbcCD nuclease subunit